MAESLGVMGLQAEAAGEVKERPSVVAREHSGESTASIRVRGVGTQFDDAGVVVDCAVHVPKRLSSLPSFVEGVREAWP